MQLPQIILKYFLAVRQANGILLPNVTGPHQVGTVVLELVDYGRIDPYAPTRQHRDLMVSFFYPTDDKHNYTLAPGFSPDVAALLDSQFGVPPGTAESFVSQAFLNAPILRGVNGLPVLLFSPGMSDMRQEYTALVEDMASLGYLVVALDHPYDSGIVEYPDGRVVIANASLGPDDYPGGADGLVYTRVADMSFALDSLSNQTIIKQIPGLEPSKLDFRRTAAPGHSLGGASSLQLMVNDTRIRCAVNFDGRMFASVVESGLQEPFMLVGNINHTRASDPSWTTFWDNSHGFKRDLRVNGTTHGSFTDLPVLLDALGGAVPPALRDLAGTISGARILEIQRLYLDCFLKQFLYGRACKDRQLLAGPSPQFPEVIFEK